MLVPGVARPGIILSIVPSQRSLRIGPWATCTALIDSEAASVSDSKCRAVAAVNDIPCAVGSLAVTGKGGKAQQQPEGDSRENPFQVSFRKRSPVGGVESSVPIG